MVLDNLCCVNGALYAGRYSKGNKKPNADVSASGSFCDYKFKIVYLIHNTSRSKEDCSNRLLLS